MRKAVQCIITHCLPPLFSPDPTQLPKTHTACFTSTTGLKSGLDSVLPWHKPQPHRTPHTWSCFSSTKRALSAPHSAAATTLTSWFAFFQA